MQHEVGQCEVGNGDCTLIRPASETVIIKSGAQAMQHVVGLCEADNGDCTLNGPTSETVIMKLG